MEKKNNENKSKGKAKVVSSTSKIYNNIQPRVVLQRLPKHYTFGIASGSDNQPSTSSYLSPNNKSPQVDPIVSDDTSDSIINSKDNILVTPSTSKASTSGNCFKRKEVTEFKVSPLREADPVETEGLRNRIKDDSSSDCSFHSSPEEVVVIEENKTQTEEGEEVEVEVEEIEQSEEGEQGEEGEEVQHFRCEECTNAGLAKLDEPAIPGNTASGENRRRERSRTDARIEKAITFLKLLIDTYGRRAENIIEIGQPSTSSASGNQIPPVRRPVSRRIVVRPQRNNLKDCLVRVWLSVRGQNRKKKFHVKLSQLILLLRNEYHPLHRFHNKLNLRTLRFINENELRVMARVLSDFVCAKRVQF